MSTDLMRPSDAAAMLFTTEPALAQQRYLGTGPKFVKVGRRVLYRRSDIEEFLNANTHMSTGD